MGSETGEGGDLLGSAVLAGDLPAAVSERWLNGRADVADRLALAEVCHRYASALDVGRAAQWQHLLLTACDSCWREFSWRLPPTHRLFVPWLRACAECGRHDDLIEAARQLQVEAALPGRRPVLLQLLRFLRRIDDPQPSLDLMAAMGPVLQGTPGLAGDWLRHLVLALPKVLRLQDLARAAAWVLPLADAAEAGGVPQAEVAGFWRDLCSLALRTLHLAGLRRVVRVMLSWPALEEIHQTQVAQALALLAAYEPDDEVEEALTRAVTQSPGHAGLLLEQAKLAQARGEDAAAWRGFIDQISPAHAQARQAWLWLANQLFHVGDAATAQQYYLRAAGQAPLDAGNALRLQHLQVRDRPAGWAGASGAEPVAVTAPVEVWVCCQDALALLSAWLAQPPVHGSPATAEAFEQGCAQSLASFRAALADGAPVSLPDGLALAHQFMRIALAHYLDNARWVEAFPFEMGPGYGRYDNHRCTVMWRGLLAHLAVLGTTLLLRDDVLRGAPQHGRVRLWLDLLRLSCDALLRLSRGEEVLVLLEQARLRLGLHMGASVWWALREQACLHLGRWRDAALARAALAHAGAAERVALREWSDWASASGGIAVPLFSDAQPHGQFELVDAEGTLRAFEHAVPEGGLALLSATDLQVRMSYGLLAPGAGLLMPHAWHRTMGEFPYDHPDVLARAPAAAVLRKPAVVRRVDEPVLVLANMDALLHRNYYHWTLFLLARASYLHAQGHLAGRRLLVPREMPGWMFNGLRDVGVSDGALLAYGRDETLLLRDALVASPVEFASPTLLDHLRDRLWRAAGLDPAAPPPQDKCLYISRRAENRRPLVDEQALSGMAEGMGFEVVAPEALSLLDQVRLFARARAIVSPPGAALANLCWTSPGVRLLVVFKEESAPPFFVDLALLRGLHYRWLMGRNLPEFSLGHVVNAPFTVDLEQARRQMAWACEARNASQGCDTVGLPD